MKRLLTFGVAAATIAATTAAATGASPPTLTTGAATNVTATSATLSGSIDPQGADASYEFQYGVTTQYGQETAATDAGSGTAAVPETVNVASLLSGTTYHFRLVALQNGAITAVGNDQTFTTGGTAPSHAPAAPIVGTAGPTSVKSSSAVVTASVDAQGLATNYWIEFGPTTSYGYQTAPVATGSVPGGQPVSVTLGSLLPGTTYHYAIVAQNGDGTSVGNDESFTTTAAPVVSSKEAIFGHTGYVSSGGIAGVFVACLGGTRCSGSVTLAHNKVALGTRKSFTIKANSGGFVNVTLNSYGKKLMRSSKKGLKINAYVVKGSTAVATSTMQLRNFK